MNMKDLRHAEQFAGFKDSAREQAKAFSVVSICAAIWTVNTLPVK